ncbi:unnamed protein product [Paramecium primaurelia]|uniref:Uncharacterized protein n=1 Tax=Paramecium primaurelia TaxID=5886 RepID=A0A8S1LC71_PARPR|nr:unnamed protein product [Paramecium primaurelia]
MMKQLKQPSQIIKIIQNNNSHNISEIIIVQEYSLVQLKENELNLIYQANEKIVDAVPIQYPLNQSQIAILYQSGHIELYQPKTNQITLQLSLKGQLKMPYKLFYVKNFLYASDYIQGMIIINLSIQEEQNFMKKDVRIISVNEIEDHTLIFYYTTKKLIQYDLKTYQEICLLENQQIQRFSNISKLFVKNNILVTYSYQTLSFYQLNPFKEINNYSKLINNKIIDILEYGLNKNQYLIIQENGQIDLITLKTEQKVSNHLNVIKLDVEEILLSYLLNNDLLITVSKDGISVFDANFVLNFQLQLCRNMTNLFEFQNNLYAIKQYNDYSKPFVLKNIKNMKEKQIITKFSQTLIIKQILQVDQYLLIITNNQIQLYLDIQQLQVLNYQCQIQQCMILDNQYVILSNDQKLQLYHIQNDKLQLLDQINQDAIVIKSHFKQHQFTIFNNNGYIQLYQIEQNKLIFKTQSQQYLDLSSYYIDQQYLIICRFDCQLTQFKFQGEVEGIPLQTFQMNSIAILINYNNITNEYIVFCQNGQCYVFDNQLNVKIINNPVGINNIVQEIQHFNNFYLITILQQRSIKYLVFEEMNDYYISIKENDSLFLSNKNELYLLNNQSLDKISLRDQEIGYLDVNIFPKQEQVLLLKNNILITQNCVYKYFDNSFEIIQDFGQEQKRIYNADIEGENIGLLLNDSSICIMNANPNRKIDVRIHKIKEEYKYQQIKLSKDIIILTYQNQVTIYSLNKFDQLEQFKAIYPDKNFCKDEEIIQIHIETHSESQLVLNLLIQQAGIAIVNLKINKYNGVTQVRLNKKIYSPIDVSEHLRMQMLQTTWQLFNTKNECQVFKHVHNFFDSSLQPIQEKPEIINDYVIDSIQFNGVIYYLGICGALWSLHLD